MKNTTNILPYLLRIFEVALDRIERNKARLKYFEMLTQLSLICDAINSRPLTYRASESDLIPLTPNDFIKMHCNKNLILQSEDGKRLWDKETPSSRLLEDSLNYQHELFLEFRKEWYNSYLLSLREYSRDLHQSEWENRIKIDDIVLIRDPVKPRPFWNLGRVVRLFPSTDGIIRSALIKRSATQTAHHSIKNLYPMELSISHSGNSTQKNSELVVKQQSCNNNDVSNVEVKNEDRVLSSRPKRQAALKCMSLLKSKRQYLVKQNTYITL